MNKEGLLISIKYVAFALMAYVASNLPGILNLVGTSEGRGQLDYNYYVLTNLIIYNPIIWFLVPLILLSPFINRSKAIKWLYYTVLLVMVVLNSAYTLFFSGMLIYG